MDAMQTFQPRLNATHDPFRRLAQVTYLNDEWMPYHGISHPEEVRRNAQEIVTRCRDYGIFVDEQALDRAILLHDSLMHVEAKLLNFRNAEELASRLAYNYVLSLGGTASEATKVERIILATNAMVRPTSVEEIIIRAADVRNIGGDYEHFAANTRRLHREEELNRGIGIDLEPWAARSFHFLRHFLWPMLELTPHAKDQAGRSIWHHNAMSNMVRFWRENVAARGVVVAEVLGGRAPQLPEGERPYFYIALEDFEPRREKLVNGFPATLANMSVAATIPSSNRQMALPDQFCDQLIVTELLLESAREAWRVLRHDGRLIYRIPEGRVGAPFDSGPVPPGFIVEKIAESKDGKQVILQKS